MKQFTPMKQGSTPFSQTQVYIPGGGFDLAAVPKAKELARFIVVACNAYDDLLEQNARLREEVTGCRAQLSNMAMLKREAEHKAGRLQEACSGLLSLSTEAARWREVLMVVGGKSVRFAGFPAQAFGLDALPVDHGVDIMRGSVAEHFTNAIDKSRDKRAAQQAAAPGAPMTAKDHREWINAALGHTDAASQAQPDDDAPQAYGMRIVFDPALHPDAIRIAAYAAMPERVKSFTSMEQVAAVVDALRAQGPDDAP